MNYNRKLDLLNSNGIYYHRIVANFILEYLSKKYPANSASVLVYGDKDLLISNLLAQKYLIHVNNIGPEGPTNTHRIVEVTMDTFPLFEYDIIIGLFCDKEFIENYITGENNFFIIPENSIECNLNIFTKSYLESKNIPFNETIFDTYMQNNKAFFNFNLH